MTDPFAYVPFAVAAHGGSVDGASAAQLTMAGVNLLRASAPLVRALHGKRSAILMPASAGFFAALAASDGRAALFIDPAIAPHEVADQLVDANVGAVFTVQALTGLLPPATVHVLLDDAPARATVIAGETRREVALTGHDALRLDGDADEPGATDPCAIVYPSPMPGGRPAAILTHRDLLADARAAAERMAIGADDLLLAAAPFAHRFGLTVAGLAPLLVGARVRTVAGRDPLALLEFIERERVTHVASEPAMFAGLLQALAQHDRRLDAPALRVAISGGSALPLAVRAAWRERTGVELRPG